MLKAGISGLFLLLFLIVSCSGSGSSNSKNDPPVEILYTVTVNTGTNGSIYPDEDVSAAQGTNQTFTIASNAGYHVEDVLIDGTSVGAVLNYTLENINANHSISVLFEINSYSIDWQNSGPGGGGAIMTLSVHPEDGDTVLLGSDVSAVYKTTDGGQTWVNSNSGIAEPDIMRSPVFNVYDFESFAYDLTNPSVVYAGSVSGLFKSIDGGDSWERKMASDDTAMMDALAIDPEDSQVVYASAGKGYTNSLGNGYIYKSINGWDTSYEKYPFDTVESPAVHSIVIDPRDTGNLIISTGNGLYSSDTSGISWTKMSTDLPHDDCREMVVQYDEGTQDVTLLLTLNSPFARSEWAGGLYKSTNWGVNWIAINGVNTDTHLLSNPGFETAGGNDEPASGWSYWSGAGSSEVVRDTSEFYDGAWSIKLSSTDGGLQSDYLPVTPDNRYKVGFYVKTGSGSGGYYFVGRIVWYNSENEEISNIVSTSGTSASPDWEHVETVHRAPGNAAYARYILLMYNHSGDTWIDNVTFETAGSLPQNNDMDDYTNTDNYRRVVFDSDESDTLYLGAVSSTNSRGVWKSIDGGLNWKHMTRGTEEDNVADVLGSSSRYKVLSLAIGRGSDHNTLYFGGLEYVYKTTDGGITWEEINSTDHADGGYSANGNLNPTYAIAAAVDPKNSDRMFYGDADGRLKYSNNGGESYVTLGASEWSGIGDAATSIIVDPEDSNIVYCGIYRRSEPHSSTTEGGISKGTHNNGEWTWEALGTDDLPGGGPVLLALDQASPIENRTLYAAIYGQGIFKSTNGGISWTSLISNEAAWNPLPGEVADTNWNVYRIAFDNVTGRIFAGFGHPNLNFGDANSLPAGSTGIWMSEDGGESWKKITTIGQEPVLDILPMHSGEVYIGTWACSHTGKGGLYRGKEENGIWNWTKLLDEQRIIGAGVSPVDPNRIYAASEQTTMHDTQEQRPGVLMSTDGGNTWEITNDNLTNLRTLFLEHRSVNLLPEAGFDSVQPGIPAYEWDYLPSSDSAVTKDGTVSYSLNNSIKISAVSGETDQGIITKGFIPVNGGEEYRTGVYVITDSTDETNNYVLRVYWYDESNSLLSGVYSKTDFVTGNEAISDWTYVAATKRAPADAFFAKVALITTSGTTWFDSGYFSGENNTIYVGTRGGGLYKGTIMKE